MWSSLTSESLALSSVKPLDGIARYRARCLDATRRVTGAAPIARTACPADGTALVAAGAVDGLVYLRCPSCSSLLLKDVAAPAAWAGLVTDASRARHSSEGFSAEVVAARALTVYEPKRNWIENTLRLRGWTRPSILELAVPPSDFTPILAASAALGHVATVDELALRSGGAAPRGVEAAILLEALDRSDDPAALLQAIGRELVHDGLIFVTALVSTGFDIVVLGLGNKYLCPPDRANCFSLAGLERLLDRAGFALLEVSTPGVLDLQIVQSHVAADPTLPLAPFERQILSAPDEARQAFQQFLQEHHMSSFARVVGKKRA